MSNNFMSAMKNTLNDEYNVSVTENGAVGYRTSGKELLDLNFAVSSLRRATPADIAARFTRAFFEDQVTARSGCSSPAIFAVAWESAVCSALCWSIWQRTLLSMSSR